MAGKIKTVTQNIQDTQDEENASTADLGYKDELNLAEFPIASLADRVPDGQLSLVFEDRLEPRDGPVIVRRLTITGTHKHGLPTAMDDEVMVGLIQLTKRRNNFTDAKVSFSRYELIELLGWPQSGQSYRRIEEALHRWVGVVLMYENAWWDNTAKSWVDENFHVLDNVTVYDRERRGPTKGKPRRGGATSKKGAAGAEPLPLSSFRWNEVIFRSFQSGNLKQLDLEFYLSLRLPTTKRLFRFLDKRFYRCDRLDFDLKTFACEHIGMSRTYKPTELKRRLKPALDELESLGFLEPLPAEERYSWQARGQWRILFIRGSHGRDVSSAESPTIERSALIEQLTERGVTPKVAAELVDSHALIRVRTKLEVFDWLVRNEDRRVGKNPAGYLVASIRSDYQAPPGFSSVDPDSPSKKPEPSSKPTAAARAEAARKRLEAEQAAAESARLASLQTRWDALSDADRDSITTRVKADNPGLRRWKSMLMPLCLNELGRLLETGESISPVPHESQPTLFPDAPVKKKR
jgi:hypothetical protein